MKLKNEFVTYTTDEVQFLVPLKSDAFSGIVRSNETAAFIVDCLKKETVLFFDLESIRFACTIDIFVIASCINLCFNLNTMCTTVNRDGISSIIVISVGCF